MYKNIGIRLGDGPLSDELRLEIYKEALKIVEQWEPDQSKLVSKYSLVTPQLCLLLPCVLWNLVDYCDYNLGVWHFWETEKAFPEMKGIMDSMDKLTNLPYNLVIEMCNTGVMFNKKQAIRVKYLRKAIIKLSKKQIEQQKPL